MLDLLKFKTKTQVQLFMVIMFLSLFGQVMVFSASSYLNPYNYFFKQFAFWILGLFVMYKMMGMDYQNLRYKGFALIMIAAILLIAVLFMPSVKGATRWLGWSIFKFQPSEFAKLAIIIYAADFLSRKPENQIKDFWRGFFPIICVLGLIAILILIEPDMGTALLLVIIGSIMCLIAGMKLNHFLFVLPLGVPLIIKEILENKHQQGRLTSFLEKLMNHRNISYDTGWQITQSLISIGSGGFFGKGLGNGMQKYGFLSDCHTDFIFPVICEELGFIGAFILIVTFIYLIWLGFKIATHSMDLFACLLATGVTVMMASQICINLGMSVSFLPTKGMPLPFISYGGSSMFFMMAAAGLLLNVAQYIPDYDPDSVKRKSIR